MKTYYMHKESGDVASFEEWKNDYDCMELDSWFGKDQDQITDEDKENWLEFGHLIEVKKDEAGDWVEA